MCVQKSPLAIHGTCCCLSCRVIVAGTVLGELVFCPLTFSNEGMEPSHPHIHTIPCCCAPVKCITWSEDGRLGRTVLPHALPSCLYWCRLLAIGGCDDAIQVLQCVTPPEAAPVHKGSLLNYCESLLHVL